MHGELLSFQHSITESQKKVVVVDDEHGNGLRQWKDDGRFFGQVVGFPQK
jgi:hypothetical protein